MLLLLVSFFANLLLFSRQSMGLASKGLLIWYQNMIPSLFPFMVFSGYLVKSGLAGRFSRLLKPFLGCFFPSDGSMLYALFMGFFCGFPMGAKVVADLLESRQINEKQGEYLLAFCNNIGPLCDPVVWLEPYIHRFSSLLWRSAGLWLLPAVFRQL